MAFKYCGGRLPFRGNSIWEEEMQKLSVFVMMSSLVFSFPGLYAQDKAPAAAPETKAAAPAVAAPGTGETAAAPVQDLKTRITAALADQKGWMIQIKGKGPSRLKYFGVQNYYGPKDGDLFKIATVDGKHYAALKDGTIFEETWENQNTFVSSFAPLKPFLAKLDKNIGELEKRIEKGRKDQQSSEEKVETLKGNAAELNDRISSLQNLRDGYDYRNKINHLNNQLKTVKKEITKAEKTSKELKKTLKKLEQDFDNAKKQRAKYPDNPDNP